MRLPGQLPLEQAQVAELAQVVTQVPVAELARLRVLVQAAVLGLALMQAQRLVQEPELEQALGLQLEREPPVVWVLEPPVVRVQGREPTQQPEPPQARELRVSRQLELQQHRLPTAAQERPPYLPALPMKAPY